MRYLIFILLILLFCCYKTASQQYSKSERSMPEVTKGPSQTLTVHYSGIYITSTCILRVLVVFIRFADDNDTSANWPDPSILPNWVHFPVISL